MFLKMATHHARCVSSCWCGNSGSKATPHLWSKYVKCGGPIYDADDGRIDGTSIHVEVIRSGPAEKGEEGAEPFPPKIP